MMLIELCAASSPPVFYRARYTCPAPQAVSTASAPRRGQPPPRVLTATQDGHRHSSPIHPGVSAQTQRERIGRRPEIRPRHHASTPSTPATARELSSRLATLLNHQRTSPRASPTITTTPSHRPACPTMPSPASPHRPADARCPTRGRSSQHAPPERNLTPQSPARDSKRG